jgi:hypothetical protein
VEQILTDVQGPGPVDVMGDMIIVFDQDLQVLWTWDAFDHLDKHRLATLNEICTPTNGLCPPFYLAPQANDWLHGNALDLTTDGNLLYSSRHQDWVIKIDYNNGAGSGNVLWTLGKDGDFSIRSTAPYMWFSHQHFCHFEDTDSSLLDLLTTETKGTNPTPPRTATVRSSGWMSGTAWRCPFWMRISEHIPSRSVQPNSCRTATIISMWGTSTQQQAN